MKLFAVALASCFSLTILADSAMGQAASRTWITEVAIISPENLNHIATGSVLIENGRIVSVEPEMMLANCGPPPWRTFQSGLLITQQPMSIAPGVANTAVDATVAANQTFGLGFA